MSGKKEEDMVRLMVRSNGDGRRRWRLFRRARRAGGRATLEWHRAQATNAPPPLLLVSESLDSHAMTLHHTQTHGNAAGINESQLAWSIMEESKW